MNELIFCGDCEADINVEEIELHGWSYWYYPKKKRVIALCHECGNFFRALENARSRRMEHAK